MTTNGSGLQWSIIRNIALAWVLTLPAAMLPSGCLYLVFSKIFQAISSSLQQKGPRHHQGSALRLTPPTGSPPA